MPLFLYLTAKMEKDILLNNFKFDIGEIFSTIQYVDNLIETSDEAHAARLGDLLKICIIFHDSTSHILCLSKNKTKSNM